MKRLLIPLLLVTTSIFSQKGYEIKVKIAGLRDTTLILGHHFGSNLYPDDTIRINAQGVGVFKGNKPLPEGMYLIFLPNKTYFDFLVTENQHFGIENDTTDLFRKIKFYNSKENEIFYNYQFYLSDKRKEMNALVEAKKENHFRSRTEAHIQKNEGY